mmetsp:Transcript_1521/g.3972  ORF Transcript_1521/g.3972 Transcript_1521/m.3972 type:complete len:86 (-) Transcript_1521:51-308(-)
MRCDAVAVTMTMQCNAMRHPCCSCHTESSRAARHVTSLVVSSSSRTAQNRATKHRTPGPTHPFRIRGAKHGVSSSISSSSVTASK